MRVRNQDRCPPMVAVFLSMETCSVRVPLEDWTGSFRVVGAEATGAPGRRSFFVPIVGQGDDRKGCGNGRTPRGNLDRGIRSLSVRIRTGFSAVDLRTIKNPWPPVAGAGPDPHSWKLKPVYPRLHQPGHRFRRLVRTRSWPVRDGRDWRYIGDDLR